MYVSCIPNSTTLKDVTKYLAMRGDKLLSIRPINGATKYLMGVTSIRPNLKDATKYLSMGVTSIGRKGAGDKDPRPLTAHSPTTQI